jgi:hypothetical protein
MLFTDGKGNSRASTAHTSDSMHDVLVQAIRYKLQKRVRRLNSADYKHFPMLLRVFFQFLENSPSLSGVCDELMARTVEHNVPATVDRILNEGAILGYELRLVSSMNGVRESSTEGKNLITLTSINDVIHLHIFDSNGKVVLDKDENELTGRASEIEDLRKKLVGFWPPHELKKNETKQIVAAVAAVVGRTPRFGTSESELAAMGYHFLKRIADQSGEDMIYKIGIKYSGTSEPAERLDVVRELFLESFYEYIDEHLDDQQAILYLLRRYKHRCEWFHAMRLRQAVTDHSQKGEKTLALDLYEFLHDQGIDFHIEPHSSSGIPDFVADQVDKDRVIADTNCSGLKGARASHTSFLDSTRHTSTLATTTSPVPIS